MKLKDLRKTLAQIAIYSIVLLFGLWHLFALTPIVGAVSDHVDQWQTAREQNSICRNTAPYDASKYTAALFDYQAKNVSPNLLTNSDFETADPTDASLPQGWAHLQDGPVQAGFSYANTGYQSAHSISTIINSGTGDAHWYMSQPISVNSQGYFIYSGYYKSTTRANISVEMHSGTAEPTYMLVGQLDPATQWTPFAQEIFVPNGTSSIAIIPSITNTGSFSMDKLNLSAAPLPGFDQGMVSITFDDGYRGIYEQAWPVLKQNNLVSTQYIIANDRNFGVYMTDKQIKTMAAAGNEIGSHSLNHDDQTKLTNKQLINDASLSKVLLGRLSHSQKITSTASPYGSYDSDTLDAFAHCYDTHRTTSSGFNTPLLNPYTLKVQDVSSTTTQAELEGWLAQAKHDKTWLILVYHNAGDKSNSEYTVNVNQLNNQMKAIKSSGLNTVTVSGGMAKIRSQLSTK